MSRFSYKPVRHEHLAMLELWLKQPHWREWWGDPETEIGYIRDMIEGRDTTRPFIFALDGEAAGYIQYWFIRDHQNPDWIADYPWLAELPSHAVGVDLSIGEKNMLGQGIGPAVLRDFTRKLVRRGHESIVIDPDPGNVRAVRAYEKAGFMPLPHLAGRTGDALIMQYCSKENESKP